MTNHSWHLAGTSSVVWSWLFLLLLLGACQCVTLIWLAVVFLSFFLFYLFQIVWWTERNAEAKVESSRTLVSCCPVFLLETPIHFSQCPVTHSYCSFCSFTLLLSSICPSCSTNRLTESKHQNLGDHLSCFCRSTANRKNTSGCNCPHPQSRVWFSPTGDETSQEFHLSLDTFFYTFCLHALGVLRCPHPVSTPPHPLPPRQTTPIALLPCRQRHWLQPCQIARLLALQRPSVPLYPSASSTRAPSTSGDRYCVCSDVHRSVQVNVGLDWSVKGHNFKLLPTKFQGWAHWYNQYNSIIIGHLWVV